MSEFEKKDECCILDSVISNTTVLQEAHMKHLCFIFITICLSYC